MSDWPFLSVILPTLGRYEVALRSIADLLAQDYPLFQVVVADQNAEWPERFEPDLAELKLDPRIVWIRVVPSGVVRARQAAVEHSSGDLLLFVDDDIFIPHQRLFRNHVRHYESTGVSMVVGRERPPETMRDAAMPQSTGTSQYLPAPANLTPLQQALWFNRDGDKPQWVSTFCTCNSSIRRSAFLAVGGFDDRYEGNAYGDDYDLALRLYERGFRGIFDPSAWLIHRRAPTGGLRLTDPNNTSDRAVMATGLWLFVLRHGHRGMYRRLVTDHVLRKTVLMRQNAFRPWRAVAACGDVVRGFVRAIRLKRRHPLAPIDQHIEEI